MYGVLIAPKFYSRQIVNLVCESDELHAFKRLFTRLADHCTPRKNYMTHTFQHLLSNQSQKGTAFRANQPNAQINNI